MRERRQPLGRIVAKNKDDKQDQLNLITVWPGRWEGQAQVQLEARMQVQGNWQNVPVTVTVHHPDGDIEITGGKEGSHFLDYYLNKERASDDF